MILLFRKHGLPSRMPSKQGNLSLCVCLCVFVCVWWGAGVEREEKGELVSIFMVILKLAKYLD